MTQSSLQTRCPKCETRFRVTDEQLSIARGKVRCGNCMDVFNAIDHQVTSTASPKPVPPPAAPAESGPAGFSADDDFVFADNPEEDAAEGRYAGSNLTFSDDELSDSFRSMDERPGSRELEEDEHAVRSVDESWAEAMLSEDEPAPDAERLTASRESAPEPEATAEPEPEPGNRFETRSATDHPEESHPPAGENFEQEEPLNTRFSYNDLRTEPVSVGRGSGGGVRRTLWSLVIVALLGLLVAQVTWFQFDRLSAIPELRPFYEQGCELAGCELKPLVDIDAIQSRKLVVRTDPDNRTQLLVEAVIINRAAFEQPFPSIALTFSNLNGDVVAQSVFTPEEYVAGEGRELSTMPTETPVRIAISIRDPGRDAVNYNIAFRAANP